MTPEEEAALLADDAMWNGAKAWGRDAEERANRIAELDEEIFLRRDDFWDQIRRVRPDLAPIAPESLHAMAYSQIEEAAAKSGLDFSDAPKWRWRALDTLVGPMLPRDLTVVGALTGNGKTIFLMSQMEAWAAAGLTVLYVPLELDPPDLRRRWAAWQCGLDWRLVARNAWDQLPAGSQTRHAEALAQQVKNAHVHFPPDRRITIPKLGEWTKRAVAEVGAKIVVIDHFHRMNFGAPGNNYRVQVKEAASQLKDIGREYGVHVVASAQLNRDSNPLDRCMPPGEARLAETSALAMEASVILMLSRRLLETPDPTTMASLRSGHLESRSLEDPNVMMVTCRKHRDDDAARDRSVRLAVVGGRVTDLAPSWQTPDRTEYLDD